MKSNKKEQTTRLLKAVCMSMCAYAFGHSTDLKPHNIFWLVVLFGFVAWSFYFEDQGELFLSISAKVGPFLDLLGGFLAFF